jgi:hypothetical protein
MDRNRPIADGLMDKVHPDLDIGLITPGGSQATGQFR